ncbi:MAG: hypothetical protein N3C60_06125 [Calditerrivibrio sp.]|nr:hypothetical protein [Calditerrivibrio sp.]
MTKPQQNVDEIPIDKVESFINRNFKRIIGTMLGLIVIGLSIYGLYQFYENQKSAEINKIGELEVKLNSGDITTDTVEKYIKTCEPIKNLKDYCYYRGGIILVGMGNEKGKEYLKKVLGDYKEFADSILYDLGEKIDITKYKENGKLSYIWKYREVVLDKSKLALLDNETLNTRLITNTKNWE